MQAEIFCDGCFECCYDLSRIAETLYCDTSFGWHTNRQSVVVRYDPDPEEAPHVTLQSPDTVFVNDDDDAHAGINDFENVAFDPSVDDDDIVPVVGGIATAGMFSSCDWNGGTGTRYYEMELKSVLIRTFLMCGNQNESRMDIPLDSVDGLIRDDSAPSGGRPSWAAIGFRGHQMHGITQ